MRFSLPALVALSCRFGSTTTHAFSIQTSFPNSRSVGVPFSITTTTTTTSTTTTTRFMGTTNDNDTNTNATICDMPTDVVQAPESVSAATLRSAMLTNAKGETIRLGDRMSDKGTSIVVFLRHLG